MPRIHRLKTLPAFLEAVGRGRKTFEVRNNDLDFQEGDILHLWEWDPEREVWGSLWIACRVIYVLPGGKWGIASGYCVLGIELPENHQWPPRVGLVEKAADPPLETTLIDEGNGPASAFTNVIGV